MGKSARAAASVESWSGRTVLVTGHTGFLGSWLCRALLGSGATVIGLARSAKEAPGVVQIEGSVADRPLLEKLLGQHEPDHVFHLAARATVQSAGADPVLAFEFNVRGTWNLLEACRRKCPSARIVVASSERVVGVGRSDDPSRPADSYLVSKRCAELVAESYFRAFGLAVAIARLSNLFGGGDPSPTRLVPATIRAALEGRAPVIRSDGSPVRDYVHVADGVDGLLRLADAMQDPASHGAVYRLGSTNPLSVIEMTRVILKRAGREDIEPRVLNEESPEMSDARSDAADVRTVPGWEPVESMETRLDETIAWYRAGHDLGGQSRIRPERA